MELGQLLRQARLEAGLSQRALCGEELTRNMLSMIENGAAHPSMDTLKLLASRLGKPISYFLEEQTASQNQALLLQARKALEEKQYRQVLTLLEDYRAPDPVFDAEQALLRFRALLEQSRLALNEGRVPYARGLLQQAQQLHSPYLSTDDRRQYLLVLAQAEPQQLCAIEQALPSLDPELMVRAEAALEAGQPERAAALLDAVQLQNEKWALLRGKAAMALQQYRQAVSYLQAAEAAFAAEVAAALETCFRELEDYKQAYAYACKLRDLNNS